MKPSLLRLMRWELRRFRGEPMGLGLLIVWIGLLSIAAWQGSTVTQAKYAEIELARAADAQVWHDKRVRLVDIEAGRATPQPFADPRSPISAALGIANDRPVIQVPTPLAALAVGGSDTAPVVKKSGMLTKDYLPPDNLDNPANRLAGRLDLVFVVCALLPLFVLALGFDVLARERELGVWPLLASQPTKLSRILVARLGLQFLLLWAPLAIAATAASLFAQPPGSVVSVVIGELSLWLVLAAIYLVFWQALAAWINIRGRSAAGNAIALCGAWLMFAVLIPAVVQFVTRSAVLDPDHLGFILAQREVDIGLHDQADEVRSKFYARHGYQAPTVALNEYETFIVENVVPRAFTTDQRLAPTLDQIGSRRESRATLHAWLAWLSPTLAFRAATERLAGMTPPQQHKVLEEARSFQRAWRAHFGAKLASMTPLTVADYDTKPEPPTVVLTFLDRIRDAFPALIGLLAAFTLALLTVVRANDHD